MDVNIGGVWKSGVSEHVNIGGVWKQSAMEYVNVGGVWKNYNPYGKVNLTHTVFLNSYGSHYSAGWVTNGYQIALHTGGEAYEGSDRIYVGTGEWNWTLDPKVDKFEMTITVNATGDPTGSIQAGIVERIPGVNDWYVHANIGARFDINEDYTNYTTTVTTQGYASYSYLGAFYLLVDSAYDYDVITVTFHSVKLNGIEILM